MLRGIEIADFETLNAHIALVVNRYYALSVSGGEMLCIENRGFAGTTSECNESIIRVAGCIDIDKLLIDSEVRPARLHDARHTAATTLLIMGVPARVVMQILGHSQIGLTLGTYSHVVPELATDAADKIAQAYWR